MFSPGPAIAKRKPPRVVQPEIIMNAERAAVHPGKRRDLLSLQEIAPRVALLSIAPRREVAIVPASLVGSSWRRMFRKSDAWTNAMVSYQRGERRQLMAARLRLVRRSRIGDRMLFSIRPLRHTTHRMPRPGARRLQMRDVTVVVDPAITEALRALWNALLARFFGESPGESPTLPSSNPTIEGDRGETRLNRDGAYRGPVDKSYSTDEERRQVQREALAAADAAGDNSIPPSNALDLFAESYDGLAVFDPTLKSIDLEPILVIQRQRVTDSAIVGMRDPDPSLTMNHETADVTGSVFRGGSVKNSVWDNVVGDRIVREPDGSEDPAPRKPPQFEEVESGSVMMRDVALPRAAFDTAKMGGCAFQRVDFSGARFEGGGDGGRPGKRFEKTFDNSLLEDVSFKGASLEGVSFAGADFTGGGVTFDGATLSNVDFTGAKGVDTMAWSEVNITGNVYGLWPVSKLLNWRDNPRRNLRSLTFDGLAPKIDDLTGFDVVSNPGFIDYLIDPATGVRLIRRGFTLVPIDPMTGNVLTNQGGEPLEYDRSGVYDRATKVRYEVDFETGRVDRR